MKPVRSVLALKPVWTRVTSAGASVGTASAPPTSAEPDSFCLRNPKTVPSFKRRKQRLTGCRGKRDSNHPAYHM